MTAKRAQKLLDAMESFGCPKGAVITSSWDAGAGLRLEQVLMDERDLRALLYDAAKLGALQEVPVNHKKYCKVKK